MPIAAVPNYLGQEFKDASPGLRFGMYFAAWDQSFAMPKDKVPLLVPVTPLGNHAKLSAELRQRQTTLAQAAVVLTFEAIATAPFTSGLGNEHPLENGFAFLNPYGLPYLPGSGVKGVLRRAAQELADGLWGATQGWSHAPCAQLKIGQGKRQSAITLSNIDVLFGRETDDGETEHVRGVLSFWDVLPQVAGDSLKVDVMTPHQGHYYQQKVDSKSGGSASPHDSGQPNPIAFLTLPPGSRFTFHVQCDAQRLARLAPELLQANVQGQPQWQALLQAAFAQAYEWLGFGAKTAVGYGAMTEDQVAKRERLEREQKKVLDEANKKKSRGQRAVDDFKAYMAQRHQALRGKLAAANRDEHQRAQKLAKEALAATDWTADEKRAAAEAIELWLPKVVQVDMKEERKAKKLNLNALKGLA
jgi:CRISPR-associated protein Cmr6